MGVITSVMKKYTSKTEIPDSGLPIMHDFVQYRPLIETSSGLGAQMHRPESRRQEDVFNILINFGNRLSDAGITDIDNLEEEMQILAHLFNSSPTFNYEEYSRQRIREIDGQQIGYEFPAQTPKPVEEYPEDNQVADECAICFEETKLLITGCRHVVCSECIVKVEKCPVCREPIVKSLIKRR